MKNRRTLSYSMRWKSSLWWWWWESVNRNWISPFFKSWPSSDEKGYWCMGRYWESWWEGDFEILRYDLRSSSRWPLQVIDHFIHLTQIDGQNFWTCLKLTNAQDLCLVWRGSWSRGQLFEVFQGGSNICWNSGRKHSNGGFVALARPTRVASARG